MNLSVADVSHACCMPCSPQADRRYQSRLQDLKDRLEQSESTNRSMQNYVQFLKSSYANVFGDSPYTTYLTSSPIRSRSPPA